MVSWQERITVASAIHGGWSRRGAVNYAASMKDRLAILKDAICRKHVRERTYKKTRIIRIAQVISPHDAPLAKRLFRPTML